MFRRSLLILALAAIGAALVSGHAADAMQVDPIITLERGALDRWGRGDPGGYLELYTREVTYFDPMREKRVDGIEAMKRALEPIKGLINIERYEMIAPHLQRAGEMAVLTYNLVSHGRRPDGTAVITRWNSTAVYGRLEGRWRIVHSHWSYTQPELKGG